MKTLVIIFLCSLLTESLYAQTLTQLGQRPQSCTSSDPDGYEFDVPEALVSETKNLFNNDQLTELILKMPHCFRVGTEAKILMSSETIGLLGRTYIKSIEILSKHDLSQKNLSYSPGAIAQYIRENPSNRYSILHVNITEKVNETFLNGQYQRLPTCFPAYGEWKTYRLPEGAEGQAVATEIQTGKKTAHIWNGTFNCYKIGVTTKLRIPQTETGDLGSIVPIELYLIHYTNLKQKHADLVGESLSSLKTRMAEQKQIDGGYVTIVVFNYLPPEPVEARERKN